MILAVDMQVLWSFDVMHNPAWKWAALLGILLVGFVAGKMISFFLERQAKRLEAIARATALRTTLTSLSKPVQMAFLGLALHVGQLFLVLDVAEQADGTFTPVTDGNIRLMWTQISSALIAVAVAWAVFRLVAVLEHILGKMAGRTKTALDDQLVPLLRKTLRVFVIIIAGLFIAQNIFEWNVSSLIAGLGIGGLAFALAAKDSLANLFGSAVIFADRPFALGDRVEIQGHVGNVEEVGFRSTKIRTLDGHRVTIPNSIVANESLANVSARPFLKRTLNVGLTYDTPPEKMQQAVDILREMLEARTEHLEPEQPYKLFFTEFNADNLNIMVQYWFVPAEWWDYLQFNHDFNMELLRRFNDEGIEFAFPTQTLYLRPEGDFVAPPTRGRAFT